MPKSNNRRKPNFAWTTQRKDSLSKALRNYTRKINQAEKELDFKFKHYTSDEIKDIVHSPESYREVMKMLRSATQKTAFKKNKHGDVNFIRKNFDTAQKMANATKEVVKHSRDKLDMKQGRKKIDFTLGELKEYKSTVKTRKSKIEDNMYRQTDIDITNIHGKDLEYFAKDIFGKSGKKYFDEMDVRAKENYIKAIEEWYGHGNDKAVEMLVNKIKSMSAREVADIIITDALASFDYVYGDEGVNAMLSDVATAWFDPSHDIFDEISDTVVKGDTIIKEGTRWIKNTKE